MQDLWSRIILLSCPPLKSQVRKNKGFFYAPQARGEFNYKSNITSFKKGNIPWNKGKYGLKTGFKKDKEHPFWKVGLATNLYIRRRGLTLREGQRYAYPRKARSWKSLTLLLACRLPGRALLPPLPKKGDWHENFY